MTEYVNMAYNGPDATPYQITHDRKEPLNKILSVILKDGNSGASVCVGYDEEAFTDTAYIGDLLKVLTS